MSTVDATAVIKNPRSEAQIASLEKARAKARELRESRNVIRQKHGITDETEETPTENTETESNSASEDEDEQPKAAVVVEQEKPVKKESKPKTEPAPKPRQPTPYHPPQPATVEREEHVPVPVPQNNFRLTSWRQFKTGRTNVFDVRRPTSHYISATTFRITAAI
jgi:hypothetical protein